MLSLKTDLRNFLLKLKVTSLMILVSRFIIQKRNIKLAKLNLTRKTIMLDLAILIQFFNGLKKNLTPKAEFLSQPKYPLSQKSQKCNFKSKLLRSLMGFKRFLKPKTLLF
jgi:hypothetical protein